MSHKFTIDIPEHVNINDGLHELRDVADDFDGGLEKGTFSASGVEGRYEIYGRNVTILLTNKPFLATWPMVENRIKELIITTKE